MKPLFKKTKYIQVNTSTTIIHKTEPNVPSGSWIKCPQCHEVVYKDDYRNNGYICPQCQKHFRMSAPQRLKMILDKGTYTPLFLEMTTENVLDFKGYEHKIQGLQEKTGIDEAVLTGTGRIKGIKVAIGVMDSRFLMGSMGHVVGERITRLTELATQEQLPLILFTASGGARMQEGIISLMQMAKTAAALKRHHDEGGFYVTVLTDPTSGGVTASFAMLGDIILSEPGAFIGFAGPRVIRDTIRQELPEGFQTAEFLLEHGFVDAIVERKQLRDRLHQLLVLHHYNSDDESDGAIDDVREEVIE